MSREVRRLGEINRGDRIIARSLHGEPLQRRATSGAVDGKDFRVVWICREEEWEAALSEGRDPRAVPWPADEVDEVVETGTVTA
jgi:hypothetical protein